jgi:acyl-coenzyme A thioesterase PaaI-like protein
VLAWGEIAPTLEMKVSYLNQAGVGRHIGEASVRKRGRQISFLEASLIREDGRLIATASGTIMIAALKRPAA